MTLPIVYQNFVKLEKIVRAIKVNQDHVYYQNEKIKSATKLKEKYEYNVKCNKDEFTSRIKIFYDQYNSLTPQEQENMFVNIEQHNRARAFLNLPALPTVTVTTETAQEPSNVNM